MNQEIVSDVIRKNGSRFAKVKCNCCGSIKEKVIEGEPGSWRPRSKNCSFCRGVKRVKPRPCLVCGKKFTPRNYQLKVGQGKFCSQKCSLKNLSGLERTVKWRKRISESNKGKVAVSGVDHPFYKGGLFDTTDGYRFVLVSNQKYAAEHRMVMSEYLGRPLSSDEIVHHKNRDKMDNRIENLQIMTRSEHIKEHMEDLKRGARCKTS